MTQAEKLGVKVDLRERRMEAHLTQRELAKLTGIPENVLNRIEKGKEIPSVVRGNVIAKVLGVTTFEIWKNPSE